MSEKITFPIRINRYLYLKNYCSRREADRHIEAGRVFINGKKAVLGDKVNQNDTVTVSQKLEQARHNYKYYRYYKPRGIVSHNPQPGEKGVEDVFKPSKKLHLSPLGRLDKDSCGLMLLSNDGRIVNKLLSPEFEHEKEYEVVVDKKILDRDLRRLARGITIEGYKTKPAQTKRISDTKFNLILTEGKRHQIRRMTVAAGYQVQNLKRTRIMHLKLGNLKEGEGRPLVKREQDTLLASLGIGNTDIF